ncbi:MAG TPA: hypothetical protein VFS43_25530 [Polyangiaceae bacterium]|nr:hypothetical protein [Polyangiaceae bacterium]
MASLALAWFGGCAEPPDNSRDDAEVEAPVDASSELLWHATKSCVSCHFDEAVGSPSRTTLGSAGELWPHGYDHGGAGEPSGTGAGAR